VEEWNFQFPHEIQNQNIAFKYEFDKMTSLSSRDGESLSSLTRQQPAKGKVLQLRQMRQKFQNCFKKPRWKKLIRHLFFNFFQNGKNKSPGRAQKMQNMRILQRILFCRKRPNKKTQNFLCVPQTNLQKMWQKSPQIPNRLTLLQRRNQKLHLRKLHFRDCA
jgi:hypothetical protein